MGRSGKPPLAEQTAESAIADDGIVGFGPHQGEE
jgi:hypothetical protein